MALVLLSSALEVIISGALSGCASVTMDDSVRAAAGGYEGSDISMSRLVCFMLLII